jgi:hypothetical protein
MVRLSVFPSDAFVVVMLTSDATVSTPPTILSSNPPKSVTASKSNLSTPPQVCRQSSR